MTREVRENELKILEKLEIESFPDPWSFEGLSDVYHMPFTHFIATVDENDNVTGAIYYSEIFGEIEIFSLAVFKSERRKGFAEELLAFVEHDGVDRIFLEVRRSNLPAISLYEKHGYKYVSTREKYYDNKEDAFVYVKEMNLR